MALIPINRIPQFFGSNHDLSGLFYAASYTESLIQRTIKKYKYEPFIKDLSSSLAFLIISHLMLADKPILPIFSAAKTNTIKTSEYLLVPVPLHKKRLRWRGFNHAELLAKELSLGLAIPLAANLLVKTKATLAQAELSEKERKTNVKDAFRVISPSSVKNKNILLVDDVYTTGSTLRECAKVLKKAGAFRIFGIVAARG
ncbi:MAG: ComF family protein [Candidatus Wildermuthbacteria bacterium]|nr:ComF family protein [Candidatus Wildermuthbacteria bacterium]